MTDVDVTLSDDAKAMVGAWFGLGGSKTTVTLHMRENKPTPRCRAALDELVSAGLLSKEPINNLNKTENKTMTDNVLNFPDAEKAPEFLIGPFYYNQVVIEGRAIPKLTGNKEGADHTSLVLDNRLSISVPNDLAYSVAWLVANALAVGAGYSHIGAESKDRPFAPQVAQIGSPS